MKRSLEENNGERKSARIDANVYGRLSALNSSYSHTKRPYIRVLHPSYSESAHAVWIDHVRKIIYNQNDGRGWNGELPPDGFESPIYQNYSRPWANRDDSISLDQKDHPECAGGCYIISEAVERIRKRYVTNWEEILMNAKDSIDLLKKAGLM